MTEQTSRGGRRVRNAATPETATGGHRSTKQNYTRSVRRNKAHLWRATIDSPLVIAPANAIISLRHERGCDSWEIDTPAGTLKCSTRGLIRFKRFRNRCAYRLGLAFRSRPTQDEWLEILNHALRNLLEEPGPAEGGR
jgi:hypothetical protein